MSSRDEQAEASPTPSTGVSWRAALVGVLLGAGGYVGSLLLRQAPGWAEAYAQGLGPALSRPISMVTGVLPISVAEWLIVIYVLYLGVRGRRAWTEFRQGRTRVRHVVLGGVRRVVRDLGVAAAAFYLLWGFNYARAPLEVRSGWPEFEDASRDELVALAEQAVVQANASYQTLHGSPDAGQPTTLSADDHEIEEALDVGWQLAREPLAMGGHTSGRWGRGKRPWSSWVLARFGIAGIYFPLTAEPHTLRGYPPIRAIHSLAHEQAHQRGFAIEAEANFVGFVVAALAPHPIARYSASAYALVRFTAALQRVDPEAAARIRAEQVPGIARDLAEVAAFWERYRWAGTRLGSVVNDRYLRANRVPGGIRSYARADRLLIEYARQNGGELFP